MMLRLRSACRLRHAMLGGLGILPSIHSMDGVESGWASMGASLFAGLSHGGLSAVRQRSDAIKRANCCCVTTGTNRESNSKAESLYSLHSSKAMSHSVHRSSAYGCLLLAWVASHHVQRWPRRTFILYPWSPSAFRAPCPKPSTVSAESGTSIVLCPSLPEHSVGVDGSS